MTLTDISIFSFRWSVIPKVILLALSLGKTSSFIHSAGESNEQIGVSERLNGVENSNENDSVGYAQTSDNPSTFLAISPPKNELRCIFVRRDVARLNACVVIHAKVLPGPVHTWYLSFLDAQAYLALSPVRTSVSSSVTLSDFHSVSPHKASRGHYGGRHGGGHGGRHGRQYGSRQKKLPDIELDMVAGEKKKKHWPIIKKNRHRHHY